MLRIFLKPCDILRVKLFETENMNGKFITMINKSTALHFVPNVIYFPDFNAKVNPGYTDTIQ